MSDCAHWATCLESVNKIMLYSWPYIVIVGLAMLRSSLDIWYTCAYRYGQGISRQVNILISLILYAQPILQFYANCFETVNVFWP